MKEILLTILILAISINAYPQKKPSKPTRTTTSTTSNPAEADNFGFPAETGTTGSSGNDRVPIHIPGKCPENQLYYPGVQQNDWICDCNFGFLYNPKDETCHPSHLRGPCESGQILILEVPEKIPKCIRNPCKEGYVQMTGPKGRKKCYKLDEGAPEICKKTPKGEKTIVTINPNTLKPDCLPVSPFGLNLIEVPNKNCAPGSKRDHNGTCRPEFG